jgi:basic membrane protein A
MAVPAVVRFGLRLCTGRDYAAKELNVPEISMNYHYTGGLMRPRGADAGGFLVPVRHRSHLRLRRRSRQLRNGGCKQANGKVSASTLTSPRIPDGYHLRDEGSWPLCLHHCFQFYDNKFPGGQNLVFDATNDGVALPMDTSKFEKFTKADYDKLYAALVADTDGIASNIMKDTEKQVTDITTTAVKVTVVE